MHKEPFKKIPCPTCGREFLPKSEKNQYCKRSCFKKAYYHRKKGEELSANHCPHFTCPSCGQSITLPFDPTKDTMRWLGYQCPGCHTLMINVSEAIVTQDAPKA